MRNIFLPAVLAVLLLFFSCGKKKQSDTIITHKPQVEKVKTTQQMSGYEQSVDVKWVNDATYKVTVKRAPDKDIPTAADEQGQPYFDNTITLKVTRQDGSEFFSRRFTKQDFAQYLDADTRAHGALLGIVFVEADGDWLTFAASVGSPDIASDEYIPLVLKLSRMGQVSIAKDTTLDVDNPDMETAGDEDDGV